MLELPRHVSILFVVDARHLLVPLGDDSHFLGRRPAGVLYQPCGVAACARQLLAELRCRGVPPDKPHERCAATERDDVMDHVGGAAQACVLRLELDDGHRRFGRDPRHVSDDEAIQHQVADDEHRQSREARDEIPGAGGVERGDAHAVVVRAAAKGSVITLRNNIRNSESPKLYSNIPAASIDTTAASAAAARNR